MSYQSILYAREGSVAVITLNQPERFNVFSAILMSELRDALATVRQDNSVRCVLFTGVGKLFCNGADLRNGSFAAHGESRGEVVGASMRNHLNPVILDLHELPVPVVVALNGAAVGAGVGLALAGDIVIAARSAYFYLPFIKKLGLVPDGGASWFLQRRLGTARALALTLTGERLSAETAEKWGLIHACVEDDALAVTAIKMAQQLARLPAYGVIESRRMFELARTHELCDQLEYEAERQSALFGLPTVEEGVKAFFEKREPEFPGRE